MALATIQIPDTRLAKEAHDILREFSTELLYNHSNRTFLFAAQQGRQRKMAFDPELLYVSAAFHDLGLLSEYSSETERFEVDGANAVRQFLLAHDIPEEKAQTAWEAIALHTTPGVTQYMRPEVALLFTGVSLDVLGLGLEDFPARFATGDRRSLSPDGLQSRNQSGLLWRVCTQARMHVGNRHGSCVREVHSRLREPQLVRADRQLHISGFQTTGR